MSSIIDDYVTVPRSMVRSTPVADFKEIKGALETDKKKTPQVSPSSSTAVSDASSSSNDSKSTSSVASRSDVKELKLGSYERALGKVMKKGGKKLHGIKGDAFVTRMALIPSPGSWVNTASTATVYSAWASPVGCAEFADFAALFEQYRVIKVTSQLWTGEINGARAVSGTSVATGTQILHNWFNSPLAASPTFDQLSDSFGAKYVDYLVNKNSHPMVHYPKGCYLDVGSGVYENSVDWQSTSKAANHVWGCYAFSSRTQAVTASGIPFVVPMIFMVEFRKRRFLP